MKDQKNFQFILKKIHAFITEQALVAGDRLPSERELGERLKVGRSSVREALKALELLGVISTRHGEGTFIEDPSQHRFIELLGLFIIQDPSKTLSELTETKALLEEQALQLCSMRMSQAEREQLNEILHLAMKQWEDKIYPDQTERIFYLNLVKACDNTIIYRMYHTIVEFINMAQLRDAKKDGQVVIERMKRYYESLRRNIS